MPESTIHPHAPDCLVPRVLDAAGNHVNASYAIRLQLKYTLSEANISSIHQSPHSQSQSNECACCVYVALESADSSIFNYPLNIQIRRFCRVLAAMQEKFHYVYQCVV